MPSPPLQSEPAWGAGWRRREGEDPEGPGALPGGEPAHKETQAL